METAKITLGELKEKYHKAVGNDVTSFFIGDVEVYVSIVKDILDNIIEDNIEAWFTNNMEIEVTKTNIFDER